MTQNSSGQDSSFQSSTTYSSYLRIDELLSLQTPLSDNPEHDELLFIIIHQSYELWFKSILHEISRAQELLVDGLTHPVLAALGRVRTILKVLVGQVDILETMTPLQFNTFRDRLEAASGFQSGQFREIEAVLGRRDSSMVAHFSPHSETHKRISDAMSRPSLWDSVLLYLNGRSHSIPTDLLHRDVSSSYLASDDVQQALISAYRNDPEAALLLERIVDIDEGLQEWRYRHVKMVERTIGMKIGTGGSSGAKYLIDTLFNPVFPDLWNVRVLF